MPEPGNNSSWPSPAPAKPPAGPAQPAEAWQGYDRPWWRPPMRDVMALASTLIFCAAMATEVWLALANVQLAATQSHDLGLFDGAAITQWVGVMGFYFGITKGQTNAA